MNIDFRGAKRISKSKDSSSFELGNGHKVTVMHSLLSPWENKRLDAIPIYKDEGGDTEDTKTPPTPAPTPQIGLNPFVGDQDKGAPFQPSDSTIGVNPSAGGDEVNVNPDAQPAAAPQSAASGTVNLPAAYGQEKAGILQAEQVAKQNAAADYQNQAKDVAQRQTLQDQFSKNLNDITVQQKSLMADIQNGHLDPNQYFTNLGTGQKIADAVGLILGGFSSGVTGKPNGALEWIKDQQDKNIAAQQDKLGRQKTLLEANQKLYGDTVVGEQATRVAMDDMLSHEIQLQTSKTGDLAAQARGNQLLGDLAFKRGNDLNSMAIRQTVIGAVRGGGGAGVSPLMLGQAGIMKPEDAQKEQSALNAWRANQAVGTQAYQQLAELQTAKSRISDPVQTGSRVAAVNARLASIIQAANPSERLTPESAELEIKPYLVNVTDNADTVQEKLNGFQQHLGLKYSSQLPVTAQYAPNSLPSIQTKPSQPKQVYQNGHMYNLNPKTGKYE